MSALKGLSALVETSFPKKCNVCGRVYETADIFLTKTQNMPNGSSSLKEALEEDGTVILEVFRNCLCGSTLMDEFNSRRDNSHLGEVKRTEFNALLSILQNQQIPNDIARVEILKTYHGQKSEILDFLLKK